MAEPASLQNALADLVDFLESHATYRWRPPNGMPGESYVGSGPGSAPPDGAVQVYYVPFVFVQRLRELAQAAIKAMQCARLRPLKPQGKESLAQTLYRGIGRLIARAEWVLAQRPGTVPLDGSPDEWRRLADATIETGARLPKRVTGGGEEPYAGTTGEESSEKEAERPNLKPSEQKAYQSYLIAEKKMQNSPKIDREAYDWLRDYSENIEQYELPAFKTWQRQVRAGRKYYGTQKNKPRHGREGRSIVKHSEL